MKKSIVVISDSVYSLPFSKVSLVNLIKHNCKDLKDYTFRSITSKSIDDLVNNVSKNLFELSNLSKRQKGTAYVLCGLNECNGGYNIPIYNTLLSSLIIELDSINYDVVFINIKIDHGLPGKIGGWYKRSNSILEECCSKYYAEQINPTASVKIIDDDVIIPIESSRIIVKSICDDLDRR